MPDFTHEYFTNSDGLKLHYRDYNTAGGDAPVVLCMPGLTRTSNDFAHVADSLKAKCRVICLDKRGRGLSEWDSDPARYHPGTYVADALELLNHLGQKSVHAIGTSMGGLMTILMQAAQPGVIKSAVINDIGPEVDPEGIKRIQNNIGTTPELKTWEDAEQYVEKTAKHIFPYFNDDDWKWFTRITYIEEDGQIKSNYDPAITQNFNSVSAEQSMPDMWPVFEGLKSVPVLIIRGETSDLLMQSTLERMESEYPLLTGVTVPQAGHAPMLHEKEAADAIASFANKNYT
ncbi:alpha/beta fold hydrolase [Kordiimonas sp. SCSIO 12610]|uniref:alpha/beta fold hydrolase n=1 Tax=Kordiimonas sp. SCSIO 12610 TaxID=2829597 RepID=UPI00210EE301|nr:alpha/beta hydrolase [Kordiimonas sp. SCSIO 12610]UTW56805.1 alpha/beta hydrolase [Kordiimonas sp. SCSIO 12610]